ncbi:putative dehydrogenase [uncultured Paludibacter sp.]|uniref:Putative dehydrogenase n=1 Tax=uncultured Paludibacter sp. TaxID=497635 RepID=A0A653AEN0_9BACT|nr:putative dehydrogenase [uncultured Paludibacter sp.]
MKTFKKVIWGVIGAGDVCEVKSVPGMYKTLHSEVKTVMRRTAAKAEDFAKRHNIPNWTTNSDDIFNDPEINIVYISTPPGSHCELTLQAAAAGKAVYVEKPMANTEEECKKMIEACEKADVPLFVAYYRRALEGFKKVSEIIEKGEIGKIRFVNIEMYRSPLDIDYDLENNWRVLPEISGGGYLHDMASHQLDYLDSIFGKIIEAKGIAQNQAKLYPADDIVAGSFLFENGVVGTGLWCFTTDKSSEKEVTTILGSKGHLIYNSFGNPMKIEITTSKGKEVIEIENPQHIQQPLIQTVVDELIGKGKCPSTGTSGARTTSVMQKIAGIK